MADDDHHHPSSTTNPSIQSTSVSSSTEFNSTMISGRSHLNELQKENRAPLALTSNSLPSILSNSTSTSTNHNY
jgi:hypothetical protein